MDEPQRAAEMEDLTTEERIRVAAVQVFTEKGYEATKTRDIANAANINIGSLHYYYRSKEKLFELVISEAMVKFSSVMDEMLSGDTPLHEKIRQFVPAYIDFFRARPHLPMFIMSESQRNPELVEKLLHREPFYKKLEEQLEDLAARGITRPMGLDHFICNLIGLIVFPFVSKPILQLKVQLNDDRYWEMLEERKTLIPEILICHLYLRPTAEE